MAYESKNNRRTAMTIISDKTDENVYWLQKPNAAVEFDIETIRVNVGFFIINIKYV